MTPEGGKWVMGREQSPEHTHGHAPEVCNASEEVFGKVFSCLSFLHFFCNQRCYPTPVILQTCLRPFERGTFAPPPPPITLLAEIKRFDSSEQLGFGILLRFKSLLKSCFVTKQKASNQHRIESNIWSVYIKQPPAPPHRSVPT